MMDSFLQFDFKLDRHKQLSTISFRNPIDWIQADQAAEVPLAFERMKQAIDDGYYLAGYVSYELAYSLYPSKYQTQASLPLIAFGVYPKASTDSVSLSKRTYSVTEWESEVSYEEYGHAFEKILEAIACEKTDQVNYTIPLRSQFSGNPYAYYEDLKRAQAANYSAYLDLGKLHILSLSPERFFSIDQGKITLQPMKGTVKRGKSVAEDLARQEWLKHSAKNKYENQLVTELMKKELESIADQVAITKTFEVEKYPTVYQMTSTIEGSLKVDRHPVDVLQALFPCASITGAPKLETIEMIAHIERYPRNVYCGAIGYFTPEHDACFNVAIRTLTIDKETGTAYYYAGGAITKESTVEEEYQEAMAKTEILRFSYPPFQLLETFLIENGQVFLKALHLERLRASADYFDFHVNQEALLEQIDCVEKTYKDGKWRARLCLNQAGKFDISVQAFQEMKGELPTVTIAKQAIDSDNPFHYHKTTERSIYELHRKDVHEEIFDILLWNERREITEFTIGNVVVELDGQLLTPKLSSGLLNGCFRQHLLAEGKIKEETIPLEALARVERIWLINSVRKWVRVRLIGEIPTT